LCNFIISWRIELNTHQKLKSKKKLILILQKDQ
jgi:hypothetical protein